MADPLSLRRHGLRSHRGDPRHPLFIGDFTGQSVDRQPALDYHALD
jgi:hypothetical protein